MKVYRVPKIQGFAAQPRFLTIDRCRGTDEVTRKRSAYESLETGRSGSQVVRKARREPAKQDGTYGVLAEMDRSLVLLLRLVLEQSCHK